MPEPILAGRKILVVEDEYLLAIHIASEVKSLGGIVLGPVPSINEANRLLTESGKPDAAILDIKVRAGVVYPLAEQLVLWGVPIIFASGEDQAAIPEEFSNIPLFRKPLDLVRVASTLL